MKAFLLAAGLGTRLRPITNTIPKCLVQVGGKPLLEHWLEKCDRYGIDEVLVNGHYLADQVELYLNKNSPRFHEKIHYVYEPELKGTGGTVRANFDFVRNEDCFFMFHADVFCDLNLQEFKDFHMNRRALLTMAMCQTKNPTHSGVIEEITKDGLITGFREKPQDPKTNLASAALFAASPLIERDFPDKDFFDFSQEILPKYVGKMYGYMMKGYHVNVGSPESLERAENIARSLESYTI